MFDKEKLSTYDERAENGERPYYDRKAPTYGEMAKLGSPKRFWTPIKLSAAVVLIIVVLGSILCISQNISIQQRQYDVQGKVGAVWNEVDRGIATAPTGCGVAQCNGSIPERCHYQDCPGAQQYSDDQSQSGKQLTLMRLSLQQYR